MPLQSLMQTLKDRLGIRDTGMNGNTAELLHKNDPLMTVPPLEGGEKSGKVVSPSDVARGMNVAKDKRNIYDDSGKIVDYDMGAAPNDPLGKFLKQKMIDIGNRQRSDNGDSFNPFSRLLNAPREGALADIVRNVTGTNPVDVGSTDSFTAPKADAVSSSPTSSLSPTDNSVPLPTPAPNRYAMPNALDPTSIEQLRLSLLTDAGQLDPTNPNGLSGLMNSPNAPSDMGQQRNQAMSIEDSIRGYDGAKSQAIKESNNQ